MSNSRAAMEGVATKVLEDWALMLVEPAELSHELFNQQESMLVATIKFKGAIDGTYSILCQQGFAECLAANLLGGEESASDEMQSDALREMANVLCGNLLTECYGEDTVFELIQPAVSIQDHNLIADLSNDRTLCYMADDQPVLITYSAEGSNAD